MKQTLGFVISLACIGLAFPAHAAMQCQAVSPKHRVALVELYTSEGCSSCPPADQWLSALSGSALSHDKVLPLSLHVDYWDYIGWKDRFASPAFTGRQRDHAARNRLSSIYTPQVVTNGRDTRDWYRANAFLDRVGALNAQAAPLTISLAAREVDTGLADVSVTVRASSAGARQPADSVAHLVMYQNGLASSVERGENAGRQLAHDRVVRHWSRPHALSGANAFSRQVALPAGESDLPTGFAAFVQSPDGEIIQAVDCLLAEPASTS